MQNDVISGVLTTISNGPCIDKNWKLEDWIDKTKS